MEEFRTLHCVLRLRGNGMSAAHAFQEACEQQQGLGIPVVLSTSALMTSTADVLRVFIMPERGMKRRKL